ncbi:sigma-70 family RNA polymerase sigma factor [Nakamurella silvestris]|nr:sigma-70 family RNA polymerase sigma factor [Nakamurella silvestris]
MPAAAESGRRDADSESRFRDLYRDHSAVVLGYALRRVGNVDDAADVVADTFLVAWRRLADVPFEPLSRWWLLRAASLSLANLQRGARRQTAVTTKLHRYLSVTTGRPSTRDRLADEVSEAIAQLASVDQDLLRLTVWDGHSPTEAAQILGISPQAARSRLFRARRGLAARLGVRQVTDQRETPKPTNGGTRNG